MTSKPMSDADMKEMLGRLNTCRLCSQQTNDDCDGTAHDKARLLNEVERLRAELAPLVANNQVIKDATHALDGCGGIVDTWLGDQIRSLVKECDQLRAENARAVELLRRDMPLIPRAKIDVEIAAFLAEVAK